MKPYVLRPAAAADVEQAYAWYEEHRDGLGEEFLKKLGVLLEGIAENPGRFAELRRGMRRAIFPRRFPYAVYFREYESVVAIVACLHIRRSPRRWQRRS